MTARSLPPRFWGPAFGLVALFALLGPAVGGAVAVPLAFALGATDATTVASNIGWVAAAIGHAIVLVPAYALGLGPAICAGLVYAIADSAAPPGAPRVLIAAAIGALFAYALVFALVSLGGALLGMAGEGLREALGDWVGSPFAEDDGDVLTQVIVA